MSQTLTIEEIEGLKQTTEEFTIGITNREKFAAICAHIDENNCSALRPINHNGACKCRICGKEFDIKDSLSTAEVVRITKDMIDVLQTTKLLYIDMPSDTARNFYTIIALLEKVPGLYKISRENFELHEVQNGHIQFHDLPEQVTRLAGNPLNLNKEDKE